MLLNLHVKNMALIDEIDIDFADHLNILTGETGAGKSILIGSINAALGAKVSKDMIRKDAEYGYIELMFLEENEEILKKLQALDIPAEEDEFIIITRRVMKNRSICKINGQTVTLAVLKEAASLLIDIHGQHEHQSLLHRKVHLEIIDSYGRKEIEPLKELVSGEYENYQDLLKKYQNVNIDEEARLREINFLQFEIDEITQADLRPGEDEELEKEYRRMCNGKNLIETAGEVYRLTGYEEEQSAGTVLGRAVRQFSQIEEMDEAAGALGEQLRELDALCNDLNRELSEYLRSLEFDETEFRETEDRLNLIHGLETRYGRTIEDILSYLEQQKNRLEELLHLEERKEQLGEELKKAEDRLEINCRKLSELRKKTGEELSVVIRDSLIDLNFLDVIFQVDFKRLDHYTAGGYDEVCFMISTNPGEPVKPLPEVASGGELSRIMLAIKSIMATADTIDTLIFDEIDVGISGRTAQMVSEKMAHIARSHQVIAITHLPQIAAMADNHYFIEKKTEGARTKTLITKLKQEESVVELARMLGGVEITDRVLENAREMKEMAEKVKRR